VCRDAGCFVGLAQLLCTVQLLSAAAVASDSAAVSVHEMGTTQSIARTEQNVPPANASLFNPTATTDARRGSVVSGQWLKVAWSWGKRQLCLAAWPRAAASWDAGLGAVGSRVSHRSSRQSSVDRLVSRFAAFARSPPGPIIYCFVSPCFLNGSGLCSCIFSASRLVTPHAIEQQERHLREVRRLRCPLAVSSRRPITCWPR
jgi:hypothetical protein